jgi:hypothetical protein
MNKQEYSSFKECVSHFLRINNVKPGCYGPTNIRIEPHKTLNSKYKNTFCQCCRTQKSGQRTKFNFITDRKETGSNSRVNFLSFSADICDNCVQYLEYGKLENIED